MKGFMGGWETYILQYKQLVVLSGQYPMRMYQIKHHVNRFLATRRCKPYPNYFIVKYELIFNCERCSRSHLFNSTSNLSYWAALNIFRKLKIAENCFVWCKWNSMLPWDKDLGWVITNQCNQCNIFGQYEWTKNCGVLTGHRGTDRTNGLSPW